MPGDDRLPVFVYGTLRPGEVNWHHAADLTARTEPARLPGHRLYELEYPCVVGASSDGGMPSAPRPAVIGDLLWLHPTGYDDALNRLDRFEDFRSGDPTSSLYVRRPADSVTRSGTTVRCWVYLAGEPMRARLRAEHELTGGEWPPRASQCG